MGVEKGNFDLFIDSSGREVDFLFKEEVFLRNIIIPALDECRPDYDKPHTEGVVFWTKQILEERPDLDSKVLITAAYLHDYGYFGLFGEETDWDEVQDRKQAHMVRGAEMARELLSQHWFQGGYTAEQIDKIASLVLIHDRLDKISGEEETLLVEADTLGNLDTDFIKPTFSDEDNERFIKEVERKRRPLFRNARALEAYPEVLEKRMEFYQEMSGLIRGSEPRIYYSRVRVSILPASLSVMVVLKNLK